MAGVTIREGGAIPHKQAAALLWTARDPLPAPAVARIDAPTTQVHGAGATVEAVRRRPQGGVFASPLSEARAMSGARGGTGAGPQGGGGH